MRNQEGAVKGVWASRTFPYTSIFPVQLGSAETGGMKTDLKFTDVTHLPQGVFP